MPRIFRLALTLGLMLGLAASRPPRTIRNVTIYKTPGRFGGWPANHGVWSWRNEILVGFSAAYFQFKSPNRHPYDHSKPEVPTLARSTDGGETWTIEEPSSLRPPSQGAKLLTLTEPMNFSDPNFADEALVRRCR